MLELVGINQKVLAEKGPKLV
jgi:hypothetical protein